MADLTNKITIKTLAEEDRPREKFLIKGRHSLSDSELLAILISSGSTDETAVQLCQRMMASAGNNLNDLGKYTVSDLIKFKGIGEAKAITILAALELGRRRKESEPQSKIQIKSSKDAFDLMLPVLADLPHEEFWVIFTNRSNKVIAKERISIGGISGTVADGRIILKKGIEYLCSSLIICHNHPSGNLQPSEADTRLTKNISEAAKILEISLIDHLIITDAGYFSFADQGLL